MTTPLARLLTQIIRKPLGTLRDDAALTLVLKRRLTKKEYALLTARAAGTPTRATLQARYGLDDTRYQTLETSITKKLNRDTIKRELYE